MKVVRGEGTASDTHLGYHIPTRGVIGLKNVLLAKARGTVIMHHVFHRYEPVDERAPMTASHGSLVAHEDGTSNAYGLYMIQERGSLFIEPGVDVYRGMVVGKTAGMRIWT